MNRRQQKAGLQHPEPRGTLREQNAWYRRHCKLQEQRDPEELENCSHAFWQMRSDRIADAQQTAIKTY